MNILRKVTKAFIAFYFALLFYTLVTKDSGMCGHTLVINEYD